MSFMLFNTYLILNDVRAHVEWWLLDMVLEYCTDVTHYLGVYVE